MGRPPFDDPLASHLFGQLLQPQIEAGGYLPAALKKGIGAVTFFDFSLDVQDKMGAEELLIGAVFGREEGLLRNDVIVFGVGLIALTFVSNDGVAGLVDRTRRRFAREVGPTDS